MSPVRSDLEDFAPIVDATRRGAHRARPSVVSEILPAVSVVLVIAVVTAVVLIVLGGNGGSKDSAKDAASTGAVPTVSTSSEPSPSEQASTEPTPSQEPEPTQSPEEPAAGGDVDKSIAFAVLNDTNTSGLAKKAATKLKSAGWTATPTTGNTSPKGRYDASVVYYKSDDDEASAKQIAADLGIAEVTKSSTKSKTAPVTVVLGKDFTG